MVGGGWGFRRMSAYSQFLICLKAKAQIGDVSIHGYIRLSVFVLLMPGFCKAWLKDLAMYACVWGSPMVPLVGNIFTLCTNLITNGSWCKW